MPALTPLQRRALRGQAALGLGMNFFLNGAAAWIGFPPIAALAVWARGNCFAGDVIGTSFFLPLTTCLVLTPLARRALRKGSLTGVAREALPRAVGLLPRSFVARGALVGLACALTVSFLPLAVLRLLDVEAITRAEATVVKAVYTAILGLVLTPLFGLRALADDPGARAAG